MFKALGKFWQRLVDWLNQLAGERSMEALGAETNESYDEAQARIMNNMGDAGAKMGVMKLQIGMLNESVATQNSQLQNLLRRMQDMTGDELIAATAERDRRVQTLAKSQAMLQNAQAQLEASVGRQQAAKFMVQDFAMQKQQARLETAMYIQQSKLSNIEEELLKALLGTIGNLQTDLKDHRAEMKERVAAQQGRVEGISQFLDATMTAQGKTQFGQPIILTVEEEAILAQAKRDAGIAEPDETDSSASQAAS